MKAALALALVALAACGFDPPPPLIDAAEPDAMDGPALDAPDEPDAWIPDGLPPDAPLIDAPLIDAPLIDAPLIDAPPIDAPLIDAPPIDAPVGPTVTASAIPLRVAVNDVVTVTFTIAGPPSTSVAWSIQAASGGGSFMPASGSVATNGAGVAILSTSYVAPALPGDLGHQLQLTAGATSTTPFETKVRALMAVGESTSFTDNAGLLVAADTLYGQAVTTPAGSVILMRVALISHGPGYSGRMALYTDVSGEPFALAASTAVEAIPSGVKEFRLAQPVPLAASSTYWLFGDFTATAPIRRSPTSNVTTKFAPRATTAALADPFGGASTAGARKLNYYLLVAQ